ncbi:MAG: ATP-binding protein [Candidatus Macondimonas sp.]
MPENDLEHLLDRLHGLADRLEAWLPPTTSVPVDLAQGAAWRWRSGQNGRGALEPVPAPSVIALDDLLGLERQKAILERNTRQFLAGQPANNALLWGARGTGKSSLVKALLGPYAPQGLRLIEICKAQLDELPDLLSQLHGRPEHCILFCDDLSFSSDEPGYQHLKAILEGSVSAPPENVLIYATSNRRHLMPESLADNRDTRVLEGEIHPGEAVEEKISLSERFGLWLSFHPFDQAQYLAVVRHWLTRFGVANVMDESVTRAALQWALERGSRNGRVAWQFAKDWLGRSAPLD